MQETQEKVSSNDGVYAGIICTEEGENFGKLLLYRRTVSTSILTATETGEQVSFRGNYELPGKAVRKTVDGKYGYNHVSLSLAASVLERAGIRIHLPPMPAFYPVYFGNEKTQDLAMMTIYSEPHPVFESTAGREVQWVNTAELRELARIFKPADEKKGISGEGLLSGIGKRMYCMGMMALAQSPDEESALEAIKELESIWADWPAAFQ